MSASILAPGNDKSFLPLPFSRRGVPGFGEVDPFFPETKIRLKAALFLLP